jgi:hypothetical protein
MNSRWLTLVSTSLVAFAILVIAWQFWHWKAMDFPSIAISCIRGEQLAKISSIVERNQSASRLGSALDMALPKDARVFMPDMTGPTDYAKIGYYYYMTYYLFPREIGVSVDQPARQTKDGFLGRTAESDQEILTCGFDLRIDLMTNGSYLQAKALHDLPVQNPLNPNRFVPGGYFQHFTSPHPESFNPEWFGSSSDTAIAFLLPLLTALMGMWLLRLLFPALSERMPLLEQLACGLGLGMMAVAALTLGVKLCGFSGRRLILTVTAVGGIAEIWHDRKSFLTGISGGFRKMVRSPVVIAILVAGLLVFLILFRLAGVQGLMEFDAVMAWSLKAKIMHLCSGRELVQWFSNPRLAHAHLDYPTLVPSLHAATYDSLGHVDEFVTKFWPAWMLFFLLAGLASLNRGGKGRFHAPFFALLGLLLLPAIQKYVQMEGGTLPMVFFTVLGFVQCALWLVGKKRARLGLGLTFLFGAAMTKFEGFIFLALVGSWMLLLPSARPSLKPSPGFWQVLAFCFLAALPFICLRIQIPSLHCESGWAGYALHNPGSTLANWPGLFMILISRLFVSPDFASWSGEGGQLHWIGRWDGLSSLYNHPTLGLAWLCLFLAVALWFAVPARRPVIVWTLVMLVGALAAFSGVFASLVNMTNLGQVIGYTADDTAGRYLLPVLLAWFATMMTMLFTELPSSASLSSSPGPKPSLAPQPPPGFAPVGRHRRNKAGKQRRRN